MFTRKHATTATGGGAHKGSARRATTLYEADLLRRHPDIAPEVLDAWSEGR